MVGAPVFGQEEAVRPAQVPAKAANGAGGSPERAISLLEPDVYYMLDEQGNLRAVVNFKYEDFVRARNLLSGIEGPPKEPAFTLQRLEATGKAGEQHATLKLEVRLTLRSEDLVRVPLALHQAVLRDPPKFTGTGEHYLSFDEGGDGYVCWIKGKPGSEHTVQLDVFAPLAQSGGETVLRLNAPRAASSKFSIEVETPRAVGRVSEGARLEPPESTGPRTTRFVGLGMGANFQIAWRPADRPAATIQTALKATGTILVRIDGRSVRSEATLSVQSFGAAFDQFRVRLPPGSEPLLSNQPGYTLAPALDMAGEPEAAAEGKLVDVKLNQKTSGPVEIRLVAEQPRGLDGGAKPFELSGFEVIGAVRQWGHIAVEVAGDWQIAWGARRSVRQVEELPESLARENLAAGFEYFSQPFLLTARIVQRSTRVRVEPQWVVFVDQRQASLEGRLRYTVRGAKVFSLNIDLRGWEWDEIGPAANVDAEAIVTSDAGVLSVRLAQPMTGQFELLLRATRDIPGGSSVLVLPLPEPAASSQTPASVAIVPNDNVELTPLGEQMIGLTPRQVAPTIQLPPRQQEPLYYRTESDSPTFAASMRVHPQAILAEVVSQVGLDRSTATIEQKLLYRVAYEPVDRVILAVPRSISLERLEVSLGGEPLAATPWSEEDPALAAQQVAQVRVALPPPARIGRFELQARYQMRLDKLSPEQATEVALPLVMPGDAKLTSNEVLLRPSAGVSLIAHGGDWQDGDADRKPAAAGSQDLRLTAGSAAAELPLTLELEERLATGSTVLERAWMQTWLTPTARQDRFCCRFTSSENRLEVTLPAGADPSAVEIMLDGVLIAPERVRGGQLALSLPPQSAPRERRLELRYHYTSRPVRFGRLTLEPPTFQSGVWIRQLYWQLVLPQDEHLVIAPSQYTHEFDWERYGAFWSRRPLREQAQLEVWAGAAEGAQVSTSMNRYLFSSLGTPGRLQVRTASRATIVLTASLIVLAAGLALIYMQTTRQPGVLFVAGLVLIAWGLVYPETALLAAQAAVLGVVLAVVAAALKRLLVRRTAARATVPPRPPGTPGGRSTTESLTYIRSAGSSSATSTVALHGSQADH